MLLGLEQDRFYRALVQVSRIIQPQNTLPVLAGVQLQASDSRLTLTATDLTTRLEAEIEAEVREPGTIVLPAQTLAELVHRLPTAHLELETLDGGRVRLRYGRNQATLHGFGDETLPDFPDPLQAMERIAIPGDALAAVGRQTLFACSREEARPILKGVSLRVGEGRLVFASTDGSRLSQTWLPVPEYLHEGPAVVIPARALAECSRLAAGAAEAGLSLSSEVLKVELPGVTLVTRLLDGAFPDYQRVIPQAYQVTAELPLSELRGALERANLIAARGHAGSVRICHRLNQLEISAVAAEVGEAEETLDCVSHGPEMELWFNPSYLLDALKSLTGDDVQLQLAGIQAPACLRTRQEPNYFHIVLPLRQLV